MFTLEKEQWMASRQNWATVSWTGQRNGITGLLKKAWLPSSLLNAHEQGPRWPPHFKVRQDSWGPDIFPHVPGGGSLHSHGSLCFLYVVLNLQVSVWVLTSCLTSLSTPTTGIFKELNKVHWVNTDRRLGALKGSPSHTLGPQFNSYIYTHSHYFFCFEVFWIVLPQLQSKLV